MSETVRITGGKRLIGEVVPIPNKNSLVVALPATILTDEKVVFMDLPHTTDVEKILKILTLLGAEVTNKGSETVICCRGVKSFKIDEQLGGQFRASLMFAGPLLARFGEALIPVPGGCDLGFRSIAAHLDVFSAVGVIAKPEGNYVRLIAPKKIKLFNRVWQLEASVTATENLLMYASGVEATFEITEAACEPHVVDLERMLSRMGAEIDGMGSNKVTVKGRKRLKGTVFESTPDFVDIAGYMVAAAITDGKIRIKGADIPEIVDGLIRWLSLFGVRVIRDKGDLVVSCVAEGLKIDWEDSGFPLAGNALPKLAPRPWPGFPVDVIPVMATLACKARGKLLLQNWMYEYGLDFVRELNSLGADIFIVDSQKIIITGPVKFKGGEVSPPEVIQSVKAVFLASLADGAITTIHGVKILQKRYPNIFDVYQKLGAEIEIL